MNVLRRVVLGVADVPVIHRFFAGNALARSLVDRFVAGETLDTAMTVTKSISEQGLGVTLDQLGENVATIAEATKAVDAYSEILRQLHTADLEPNISVKLTMLGLDLGDDVSRNNMHPILDIARDVNGFVRIDMEGAAYADRTMRLFSQLHDQFPDEVGIVIQTYLYRAAQDVADMIERGARVRLVKGAYAEPDSVAFQSRKDIDDNYITLMKQLLERGRFPAIATHDPAIIEETVSFARANNVAPERFEFQMLYGVRRSEQARLKQDGWGMRVYVPYGTQWYPYFTRRIAERPTNALFVLRQLADR